MNKLNNKKAQGLSINMIIMVAIGLLVLIIIAILIMRSGKDFSVSTDCIKKGGICRDSGCGDGETPVPNPNNEKLCGTTGAFCCMIK